MNSAKKEAMQSIINGSKSLINQLRHDLELLESFEPSTPTRSARNRLSDLLCEVLYLRDFVDEL